MSFPDIICLLSKDEIRNTELAVASQKMKDLVNTTEGCL